jgi:regulator of cell morphogenesis and NO signaling
MINANTTVKQIALQVPNSTRLFESLKIDYCCGGNQPLAQACATAGIDVDDVMKMLAGGVQAGEAKDTSVDFQNASLPDLITHIVDTHHVFTKSETVRLEALAAKVIAAHGANHPELIKLGALVTRLSGDLAPHMFKEEQILFPFILAMTRAADNNRMPPFAPFGTVNNPIRMMMSEHDAAGEILRELRTLTSDYRVPADACISYRTLYEALEHLEKDLHQHIHLENNILFPKALDLENALNR